MSSAIRKPGSASIRRESTCIISDLILRSAPRRGVSKDGRESVHCRHPSRRCYRKLLRMRSVFADLNFQKNKHTSAISRRDSPELCYPLSPPKNQRAQGRPGARCTRGLVCKCTRECAHEHTGPAESIRPSLRNGFTAYVVIFPVSRALLPPSPLRNSFLKNLAPASGARTTRFCRTLEPRASGVTPASTASCPASVTIASAPLSEQDGQGYRVIWFSDKQKYFCKGGLTGFC